MKKAGLFIVAIFSILILCSFNNRNTHEFTGTYGVSTDDPSQIKLILNSEHTFYYQDFSNPGKKIVIQGSWKTKGKKVYLTGSQGESRFHKVWSFDENGQVAKSRTGLAFYRLCKISG